MSPNAPEPEPHDQPLSALEAELASIAPTLAHFNRDVVLFQSGQRTAERNYRRSVRRWQTVCGMLGGVMLLQTAWVWQSPGPPTAPQLAPAQEQIPPGFRAPRPVELMVEDSQNSPPALPTEDTAETPSIETDSSVAARGAGLGNAWHLFFPSTHQPWQTAAGPGLRSGSSLRDLEDSPGFIPRRSLAGDSSITPEFPFSNPRIMQ